MKNTKLNRTKKYLKSKKLFTESQIDILAKELQFVSEQQLNEWSLQDLKDKAQEILNNAKDKTSELIDKAKSGELTRDAAKKVQAAKDAAVKAVDDLRQKAKDSGLTDKAKDILSNVKDEVTAVADKAKEVGSKVSDKASEFGNKAKEEISKKTGIKPETLDKVIDTSGNIVFSILYKSLNGASGGNVSDQVIEHYMNEVGNKMSEDELKSTIDQLVKDFPKLKKQNDKDNAAEDKENADKEADKNESTEIDESSCMFYAMFQGELGKNLKQAIVDMDQQQAKAFEGIGKFEKNMPKFIDENGGKELSDEDKKKYGMLIIPLLAKGLKGEELKKTFEAAKKGKTSDGKDASEEDKKDDVKKESIENKHTRKQINESIELGKLVTLIQNVVQGNGFNTMGIQYDSEVLDWLGEHAKGSGLEWVDKISGDENINTVTKTFNDNADFYEEFKKSITNDSKRPALGFNFNIVGPLAVMAAGSILYKYRKPISNGIGKFVQNLKNKKGVIAAMKFKPQGSENEYKLQFSVTDFVWRVVNLKDSKKAVKEELVKGALDSDIGKKFRKKCAEIWTPIFGVPDNDKMPVFYKLIEGGGEALGLSKNDVKSIKDFGDNFKKINETCLGDDYKYDIRNK